MFILLLLKEKYNDILNFLMSFADNINDILRKGDIMDNENKKSPSRFPDEIPTQNKKHYDHGVIEDVVRNEIDIKSATNPIKPMSTDSINTEFAKQAQNNNFSN